MLLACRPPLGVNVLFWRALRPGLMTRAWPWLPSWRQGSPAMPQGPPLVLPSLASNRESAPSAASRDRQACARSTSATARGWLTTAAQRSAAPLTVIREFAVRLVGRRLVVDQQPQRDHIHRPRLRCRADGRSACEEPDAGGFACTLGRLAGSSCCS